MTKSLEGGKPVIDLFLLPFIHRMGSKREYRVYCAPLMGAIAAVNLENNRKVMPKIWSGIQKIHHDIMEGLDLVNQLDQLLLKQKQGYSFDVFYDETEERSSLVELNVFGARSGCGSCLFHWIDDLDKLYGEGEHVEFRITR
ncbi:hypothetical protein HYE67_010682 [Fusarium culmorum]|uniref:Cell division cycle protein 123 n=1 Tax=Fusarium culmorum TaxID=5516 RepID=A0A2T4GGV2_FUSCU|nr:hypothetical protein FCULG_00009822 [Fusarium culmorum]QPC68451.1 hypothetical protein HYE67_010682 [Fusarium culmorum]